jgi:lipopolysaccharide biosynthesis protein
VAGGKVSVSRTSPWDEMNVQHAVMKPIVISVVLPQFHPIPENDEWWGKGFTEWTNVVRAKPLFPGHYQPHLPGELGFYDLRVPEVRDQQAALASAHAIDGFCYYHYWFNGRRLLGRPLDEILQQRRPDFPFCMCWANENWTRAWDGRDREILIEQKYSSQDDEDHIRALLPFLADPRYMKVGGRPLFIVYKASALPDPMLTFKRWRAISVREGVGDLCLAQFEAGGSGTARDPREIGLDLSIEFTPDWRNLGGAYYSTRKARIAIALGLIPKAYRQHRIFDYRLMVKAAMRKPKPGYPFLRCVTPGFDSTSRRPRNATVLLNSTPDNYANWLRDTLMWTKSNNSSEHQIVFINAWNEWAEGNHLEPDARNGRAYLEATRAAILAHSDSRLRTRE